MTARPILLGGRAIGPGQPCLVIAEAGVNHNGSLETGLALVEAAAKAGAEAVKFQTFKADRLVSREAPKAGYQLRTTSAAESQYEMIKRLELSRADHLALMARCQELGLIFLSSPFDQGSADLLEEISVPGFKVPSGELVNLPFLEHLAAKGRPMILSTGMADLAETRAAVAAIARAGKPPLALLHCVSAYPADPTEVNLRAMASLTREFGLPVGFSDHTQGIEVSLAAVALGATIIEKHFTLDRQMAGPDHAASIEPDELKCLIKGIRKVESALGDGRKKPTPGERNTAEAARRSIIAARDIPPGTVIGPEMLVCLRPGSGIPPSRLAEVLGRKAAREIRAGELIGWEMLS